MAAAPEPASPARAAQEADHLGKRAARTRDAIIEATRTLFLTRGYAGTRIANITDECGISRAGFYTYFRDKREVFDLLGASVKQEGLDVLGEWESMPSPCGRSDVESWVRRYFAFLDRNGAFIFSAHTSPDGEAARSSAIRGTVRGCFQLGLGLRSRQRIPTETPEVLGMTVKAMLDRSWHQIRVDGIPVDEDEVVGSLAGIILSLLDD